MFIRTVSEHFARGFPKEQQKRPWKGRDRIRATKLTSDDVEVAVLVLVVLVHRMLGRELALVGDALDVLVLFGEADVAVGVQGRHVLREQRHRNGPCAIANTTPPFESKRSQRNSQIMRTANNEAVTQQEPTATASSR